MEIHAPHHPIHSWREFFVHIATIVVGLLIAIGLEQGVEWLHHRHIVREARENIRQELESNQRAAEKDLGYLDANIARMRQNLDTLRSLRTHPKVFHGSLENAMSFSDFNESAWRSARDTGALAYMPYGEVQKISAVYNQQEMVGSQVLLTFQQELIGLAPVETGYDVAALPDEDYVIMLRADGTSLIQLTALRQFVQQLDAQYKEALKSE